MTITIRPATVLDAEPVGRLVAEFQDYLRALGDPTEFGFGAAAYRRDGFGDDPAFAGFVAELDAMVVGYLLYHSGYDTDRGHRLLHVVDLYVQEASRGQGIGRALMQRAAAVGRAHGARAMLWSVYKPNELALRFYEGLGATYIEDLRFMVLEIHQA